VELLPLENIDIINYYVNKCTKSNITIRRLRKLIKSKEYERLPEKTKNKLITKEEINITDVVPNPIVINNPNNADVVKEKVLQQLILEDTSSFLKQLGQGFSYIDNEYPIKLGDTYNYIDILLFNYIYNCFVVVELKLNELRKEYIGQIETYVNYIDNNVKRISHNKTIGMIVSKLNKDINIVSEKILKNAILENIEDFMSELGDGYSFIKSEYKIKDFETNNYIDILLFNYIYNCFVIIELKVTELKKEHIGQIEVYMNYIDNNLRKINQDKTIGIILTKKDNKYIIEYCSDKRIISREYELVK
jgi:predicted nuclease of restriction endonuclease-like (RecB) superfamily